MESAVMTSAVMSSQSTVGIQQMRREVNEMKRRHAEQSADGLALMTSSVTSSYSADGLREQSQDISRSSSRKIPAGSLCLIPAGQPDARRKCNSLSVLYKTHFKREEVVSNGKKSVQRLIYFKSAIEEDDDVGATTELLQKYIDYTVHQQRENEQIDEAIDRH
ncbi:callose synthase 12-like [Dorcoceras hygrometricum]|uniref:Callose synthase 12-like n=1 Tax=Dorcoceras hygrometricum TaxID=472368 RepID=A0A2Z7AR87_9LAMI|nr:callose synthase 12-like [Dorcoceras hygrometricum]